MIGSDLRDCPDLLVRVSHDNPWRLSDVECVTIHRYSFNFSQKTTAYEIGISLTGLQWRIAKIIDKMTTSNLHRCALIWNRWFDLYSTYPRSYARVVSDREEMNMRFAERVLRCCTGIKQDPSWDPLPREKEGPKVFQLSPVKPVTAPCIPPEPVVQLKQEPRGSPWRRGYKW